MSFVTSNYQENSKHECLTSTFALSAACSMKFKNRKARSPSVVIALQITLQEDSVISGAQLSIVSNRQNDVGNRSFVVQF